jgi:hypothetical protein
MSSTLQPARVGKIRALRDSVIVTDMQFKGRTLSSGIILPGDDGKADGIRPRWGQIYAVGPEQHMVSVGQWICVAHGRWTRGVEIQDQEGLRTIRRIDPRDILLVADQHPGTDDTISSAVSG